MCQSKSSDESQLDSTLALNESPRLRIVHFLIWIAICALYLAVAMQVQKIVGRFEVNQAPAERLRAALQALVSGTIVTGVVIFARELVRGNAQMLRHPGHWLLLSVALAAIADYPCELFSLSDMAIADKSVLDLRWFVFYFAASLILTAASVAKTSIERKWRMYLAVLAAANALQVFGELAIMIQPSAFGYMRVQTLLLNVADFTLVIACVVLGIISFAELSRRTYRDYLHWIGVGAYLAPLAIMLLPGR